MDGVPGRRRSPGAGGDPGLSHSPRSHDGSGGGTGGVPTFVLVVVGARFAVENVEHPTARLAARANVSRPTSNSGSGPMAPPRSTVSTAAWHGCQLPAPSSPTAPLTGLIVLPAASYSNDWNTAASRISR
jgi:hypothetical protein